MTPDEFAALLAKVHAGSRSSLGRLLDGHRKYLLAVANAELHPELVAKAGGSDLVQQTFTEAQQSIEQFRGTSAEDLRAWLRRILLNNIIDLEREYLGTAARDVRRERPMTDSRPIDQLPDLGPSPSSQVASLEDARRLNAALVRMPEDYRVVIELRNRDRLRFAEIGERLQRSEDAARMLWARAVERLQQELNAQS